MEIFLVVFSYFLIVGISVFLVIAMNILINKVRQCKKTVDNIEKEAYLKLRDIQYKSKDATKFAKKLNQQKKSIIEDLIGNALIMLLPFKKLKAVLLLRKFARNIKSGFTFAELMISLLVISILAAVLYPNLMHFLPNTNKPLFKAAYKTLSTALAEITTEKANGRLQTDNPAAGGVFSGQQLCIDFCNKANVVPEQNAAGMVTSCAQPAGGGNWICSDSQLTTTNGMRWLFENYNNVNNVLEFRNGVVQKASFRITVDVNPSNSNLPSVCNCGVCGAGAVDFRIPAGQHNCPAGSNCGVFCYDNTINNTTGAYTALPTNLNVNGTFNINNAKAQDTFQFLVDEKGKIISISPVGWAILEDNIQLD